MDSNAPEDTPKAGVERSNSEKDRSQGKTYLSEHPMVLLLLGTAISAVLIPYISGTISDRKLLQDERSKQALTIIEESGLVDKHLETLQTTCEMFTKDTHGERKEIVEAQRQLKKDLDEQYRTFNEHAWFWHRTLELRSILLKVPDKDRAIMRELLDQYRQNLVDSTKA